MHRLTDKAPKPGKVVQVHLVDDPSRQQSCVFFGTVLESSTKSILLGGVYENTPPLKGCTESGTFVPIRQETISFPRRRLPSSANYHWKTVPLHPTCAGQYFVYVNSQPVALSIVNTKELTNRPSPSETNYLCLVGGTHAFYASDMDDVQRKLRSEELCAFPEYTNEIYTNMIALLSETMKRKFLRTFSKSLHSTVDETQATELKL
jgi:hypothetical protein